MSSSGTVIDSVVGAMSDAFPFGNFSYAGVVAAVGQEFTGNGDKITETKFYLALDSNYYLNVPVRAAIYSKSNGFPNTRLAVSATVDTGSINVVFDWVTFAFSGANQLQTVNGQKYFIVIESVDGYDIPEGLFAGCTDLFNGSLVGNAVFNDVFWGGNTNWRLLEDFYGGGWFDGVRVMFQAFGTVPSCLVTYNGNGHTGGSVPTDNNSPYNSGATVTVLGQGTIAKSGSIFLGWATSISATLAQYTQGSKFTIINNVVLYAVWGSPSTPFYKVTYNGNGATGGNAPLDNTAYSQNVSVTVAANPGALVRKGYKFLGWSQTPTDPTPTFTVENSSVNPSSFNMQTSNITLYAIWRTISGGGNGKAIVDQIIGTQNSAAELGLFSYAGDFLQLCQGFTGDGTKIVEACFYLFYDSFYFDNTKIRAAIYAHNGTWGSNGTPTGHPLAVSNSYFVNAVASSSGGWAKFAFSGGNQFQTVAGQKYFVVLEFDENYPIPVYESLWIGLTADSSSFNGGSAAVCDTFWGGNKHWLFFSSERVLFQLFNDLPSTCTVTYNGNGHTGGSAPVDGNSPYNRRSMVTVLGQGNLTKSGKVFLGWATTINASLAQYAQDSKFVITDDVVLYAVWGPTSTPFYAVTYNGNGSTSGSAPIDSNSYSQNVLVTVKANTGGLLRVGYQFLGWSDSSTASTPDFDVNGLTVKPINFNMPTYNVVLYAVWREIPKYVVIYDGNGASSGTVPVDFNSPYLEGSEVTVLGNTGGLTKNMYVFGGWLPIADGENIVELYNETSTFTITENITLYAYWLPTGPPTGNQYQVFYNKNGKVSGGSVPYDLNVYQAYSSVSVKANPGHLYRSGYDFLGWATKPAATKPDYAVSGNTVTPSTFNIGVNSAILYAVWRSSGGGGGSGGNSISPSSTIYVARDERYGDSNVDGSKKLAINYTGNGQGEKVIIQVEENVESGLFQKNAIIENLVINGNGKPGTVGILLKNVYNCIIRNVTIIDCDIGIKIENTNNYWSQSNHIEHVMMRDVKKGVLFVGAAGSGDFGFTTIRDVGIVLRDDDSSNVGIQVGTQNGPIAKLHNAFIKTTVWVGKAYGGCGMRIYGELKYSLVMFTIEDPEYLAPVCVGVDIQNNQLHAVFNNQSFMLTYGSNKVATSPPASLYIPDITVGKL